jgi:hypothetical protein
MFNKIKELLKSSNEHGVFIPLLRNKTEPSVSLTLLFISSIFVILSLLQLFKINFFESLAWYLTSAVLYYNRSAKVTKDGFEISSNKESTDV